MNLGIKVNNKREPVFDNNQIWVDTVPLNVTDYSGNAKKILEYKVKCLQELNEKYIDNLAHKDRVIYYLESKVASLTSEERDKKSHSTQKADDPKKPTSKQPPKGKKKKKPG